LERTSSTIEGIGYEVIDRIAKFRVPVGEEERALGKPVEAVPSIREELLVLQEVKTRLANVKDAFSRCVIETEQAEKAGKVDDDSFRVINTAWGDCKRKFLARLLAYASFAQARVHFTEEYFSKLERQVENLDRVIEGNNRGGIPRAVRDFEAVVRTFTEAVDIQSGELIQRLPGSKGGQADD
jgi:hypothetical protein